MNHDEPDEPYESYEPCEPCEPYGSMMNLDEPYVSNDPSTVAG